MIRRAARDGDRPVPETWRGFLVALLFAAIYVPWTSERMASGWDEGMHVGLPATRLAHAAAELDAGAAADTLLGCHQYPFVYPLVLAASQTAFGDAPRVARRTGRALWALTAFGAFLLVRSAARRAERARGKALRGADFAPWLVLAAALASPLAIGLSGTLFLEVPFCAAAVFTLLVWLHRDPPEAAKPRLAGELAAGALLTVAFFTKFNYGLLLAAGLALDLALDLVPALRAGRGRAFLVRAGALAAPPAVALLWWFELPLPGGLDVGALHRAKLAGFLVGNTDLPRVPFARRLLHWTSYLVVSPRAFLLLVLGVLVSLRVALVRGPRALWACALAFVVPITLHPFHLDRFLLPCAVPLFGLAALGWAAWLPRTTGARILVCALAALCVGWAADREVAWLAARTGVLADDDPPEIARYKREVLAEGNDLAPWRTLPTGGLPEREQRALLDLVAPEVGPDECPGWIGVSPELSPASLWLGLLARGWPSATFLRCSDDEPGVHYVTIEGVDPGWSDERLAEFASAHDVIFHSVPIDLRDRPSRRFLQGYVERLLASGWTSRELGVVQLARPLQAPLTVRIAAARRPASEGR